MKIRYAFYSITAFLMGVLLAVVIGYTTDTQPHEAPKQQAAIQIQTATAETVVSDTEKKKNCGCCAERRERLRKLIQQARERRQAKQQTVSTGLP